MDIDSRLEKLEKQSLERIQGAIDRWGDDLYIACSFGKDSIVVLTLALQLKPDIMVLWNNTLNEHSETIKFAKQIINKYQLNFSEMRAMVNFFEVTDELGLPTPTNRSCCDYLKLKPTLMHSKQLGLKAGLTGLRRDESRNRENLPLEGPDTQVNDNYRFNPIADWTELDVYNYHIKHNIPLNPLYMKGYLRTGCQYCTLGTNFGGLKVFKEAYPKKFAKLEKLMEKDPAFEQTKNGVWRIIKPKEKIHRTTKNLNRLSRERLADRINKGDVLRVSKWFNRETPVPYVVYYGDD